jgi:hypothetical protein
LAPTEKLAPTGKVGALATLGLSRFKPTRYVGTKLAPSHPLKVSPLSSERVCGCLCKIYDK